MAPCLLLPLPASMSATHPNLASDSFHYMCFMKAILVISSLANTMQVVQCTCIRITSQYTNHWSNHSDDTYKNSQNRLHHAPPCTTVHLAGRTSVQPGVTQCNASFVHRGACTTWARSFTRSDRYDRSSVVHCGVLCAHEQLSSLFAMVTIIPVTFPTITVRQFAD